jgi:serine-type D-Ala-D-Ala carboxypeptidase/endopeptidase (penicillin-binding protein 4)
MIAGGVIAFCAGATTGSAGRADSGPITVRVAAASPAPSSPGATPDRAARSPETRSNRIAATRSLSRSALGDQLAAAMRSAGGASGAWVFHVGAQERPVLFARSARTARILASNQKLFTTAAVLERFGAEHRFETAVHARGTRRGPRRGVLRGDLVIRGDGDPALAGGRFARRHGLPLTKIGRLAGAVKQDGIRTVAGSVRADDSIFDRRRGIPSTSYRSSPWLSPLSGLSFNSGFGSRGYASSPELEAARTLRRLLVKRGVEVRGGVGRASLGEQFLTRREPVGTVRSPRLATLAATTNKPSNNFFAEMLLKRLGGGGKRKGTTHRGARRVERFAKRVGSGVRASDGSGLGRSNRGTPKQVGQLVRAMIRAGSQQAFRDSLAIAGRDGTLASRMRGTAAEGRCRGKTGTLTGVSTLSGFCNVATGRVVFSILMNGVDATRARSAQDRMIAAIARYGDD